MAKKELTYFGVNINTPSAEAFNKARLARSAKEGKEITKSDAMNEAVDLWNEKYNPAKKKKSAE